MEQKCHVFSVDANDPKKMIVKVDNLGTFPEEIKDLFQRDPVNEPRKSDILEDGAVRGTDFARFDVKGALYKFIRY